MISPPSHIRTLNFKPNHLHEHKDRNGVSEELLSSTQLELSSDFLVLIQLQTWTLNMYFCWTTLHRTSTNRNYMYSTYFFWFYATLYTYSTLIQREILYFLIPSLLYWSVEMHRSSRSRWRVVCSELSPHLCLERKSHLLWGDRLGYQHVFRYVYISQNNGRIFKTAHLVRATSSFHALTW